MRTLHVVWKSAVSFVLGDLLLVVGGCCHHHTVKPSSHFVSRDILFGPVAATDLGQEVGRSDWPSTDGSASTGEQIDYAESIIDLQGRGYGSHDGLYRRFDSVRIGRQVR